MPYASKSDIDQLYGEDLLVRIADYDRDGLPDDDVVTRGLQSADEICNAYLSSQYPVPVIPTPGVVRTCAIDIAVYKIALGRGGRTDEMRTRYEDALMILDRISTGKVGLGLPVEEGEDENGNPTTTNPNIKLGGRSFDTGRA